MRQKKFNVMQSADSNEHVGIWYVNDVQTSEINEAVYAVFCVVAQAVLDRSKCFISGDHTAAEIAGSLGSRWCKALVPLTDEHHTMAPETVIKVGGNTYDRKGVLFECRFQTEEVFEQMAEWEGVMSLTKQKQHTFGCECCQESFKNAPLKPYARCHQSKAANPYSAARETTRINKKFEVLGELRRRLSSEGMKKALAVLCAAKQWENTQSKYRMALEVMRRRLWKDYGTDQYAGPMAYTARDFEPGPEIWKQVDVDYANMLRKLFCDMLNAAPAPKWPSVKDYVQVKDKTNLVEHLKGKLYVTSVYAKLDGTGEKLVWFANVVAAKGRECQFKVDRLEPWSEPKKNEKMKKCKNEKKHAAKKVARTKAEPAVAQQDTQPAAPIPDEAPTRSLSIEDRLRAALRRQLAMAA